MFDKKQFDAALTYLGDLTDEQKAVLKTPGKTGIRNRCSLRNWVLSRMRSKHS